MCLARIFSPGTAEGAAESFTYDLHGHQATRTDFGNNVWTRIEDSCCDKQTASVDPLGLDQAKLDRGYLRFL